MTIDISEFVIFSTCYFDIFSDNVVTSTDYRVVAEISAKMDYELDNDKEPGPDWAPKKNQRSEIFAFKKTKTKFSKYISDDLIEGIKENIEENLTHTQGCIDVSVRWPDDFAEKLKLSVSKIMQDDYFFATEEVCFLTVEFDGKDWQVVEISQ
jgi:hypothetical protein